MHDTRQRLCTGRCRSNLGDNGMEDLHRAQPPRGADSPREVAVVRAVTRSSSDAMHHAGTVIRAVDRLDRTIDREPEATDLGCRLRLRLKLPHALPGGERKRVIRPISDLARPDGNVEAGDHLARL